MTVGVSRANGNDDGLGPCSCYPETIGAVVAAMMSNFGDIHARDRSIIQPGVAFRALRVARQQRPKCSKPDDDADRRVVLVARERWWDDLKSRIPEGDRSGCRS